MRSCPCHRLQNLGKSFLQRFAGPPVSPHIPSAIAPVSDEADLPTVLSIALPCHLRLLVSSFLRPRAQISPSTPSLLSGIFCRTKCFYLQDFSTSDDRTFARDQLKRTRREGLSKSASCPTYLPQQVSHCSLWMSPLASNLISPGRKVGKSSTCLPQISSGSDGMPVSR